MRCITPQPIERHPRHGFVAPWSVLKRYTPPPCGNKDCLYLFGASHIKRVRLVRQIHKNDPKTAICVGALSDASAASCHTPSTGRVAQRSVFHAKCGAADSRGGLCRPADGGGSVARTRRARSADRRPAQGGRGNDRRRVQLRLVGTFKAPARLRKAGAACPANRWKAYRWHGCASFALASWSTGNYADGIGLNSFNRNRGRRPPPQQIPWRHRLADFKRRAAACGAPLRGKAPMERRCAEQHNREKKRNCPQAVLRRARCLPTHLRCVRLSHSLRTASSF